MPNILAISSVSLGMTSCHQMGVVKVMSYIITFGVSRRQREMYIGYARLCVSCV